MATEPRPFYEFGEFRLEAATRKLWRGDRHVTLGQKATEALVELLARAGEVVEKDALVRTLWPDTVVEDNNLNQQISALRRALGETAEQPRHIITVPGRGYRLVVPDPVPAPSGTVPGRIVSQPERPSRSMKRVFFWLLAVGIVSVTSVVLWQDSRKEIGNTRSIRSLAVLPLRSLSPTQGDEHFGLGISDAIIRNLTAFEGVLILPPGAVRQYTDTATDPVAAGRALSVDAVLDGTVQRAGNRLRVSVQLVRVDNGASAWTERFDTDWGEIFSVQDAIARQVARALALQLKEGSAKAARPRRATTDAEAYAAYLKSRYFWNKRSADGYVKGIELAQAAVTRDPAFALAYAALADCYALLGSSSDTTIERGEAMNRARQAAERSLALDPSSAEATTSLAFVKMHYDWDWSAAERMFQSALALDPEYATAHHWYGYLLTARRRHDEAIAHIRRASELDPLSVIIATDVGELLLYAGRVDEAVAAVRAALELDPAFVQAHRVLAWADMRRGNHDRAARALLGNPSGLSTLGHVFGLQGRREEAMAIVNMLKKQAVGAELAVELSVVYAGLGAKDEAFYWLDQAFRARSGSLILLMVEPLWAPLRTDARFADLARRVGHLPAN